MACPTGSEVSAGTNVARAISPAAGVVPIRWLAGRAETARSLPGKSVGTAAWRRTRWIMALLETDRRIRFILVSPWRLCASRHQVLANDQDFATGQFKGLDRHRILP